MSLKKIIPLSIIIVFLIINSVSAQNISMDIKIDKNEYSPREDLTYTIFLLENNEPINKQVKAIFSDALEKTEIEKTVQSNQENKLMIADEFASGYWTINAFFENKTVKRIFTIKENEGVVFKIIGDELIITNTGNTPYTKTVQILIGDTIITQKQDISVGESNSIRLIAPDGTYNVEVTDGQNSMKKSSVTLTGNAIGILDKSLLENMPIFGTGVRNEDEEGGEQLFPIGRILPAMVFIGGVLVLGALSMIERRIRKRK